jgi:predicted patatin/cPLA2 family phospholipase
MNKIGAFLDSGGNKVFFVNGVLKILEKENVNIDHLIGLSSSSAILFAHLFSCHDYILEVFGNQLKNNKKNFYFLGNNKFPHNKIYKSSIQSIFTNHNSNRKSKISYSIIATRTPPTFKKTKGIVTTIAMGIKKLGLNTFPIMKSLLNISKISYDSRTSHKLSDNDLINFIMGSSTIYPFIDLYTLEGQLILDGGLAEINPLDYLREFDKKIIIHTEKGETCIKDGILHIYSSHKIPNNILDYTDNTKIKLLQNYGENDAKKNIKLIKTYTSTNNTQNK